MFIGNLFNIAQNPFFLFDDAKIQENSGKYHLSFLLGLYSFD